MVVDIAPQQQLTEVFATNHSHHRSSSASSSLVHRRNSTTTNSSSSVSNNNNHNNNNISINTMTNGHYYLSDELGKKADLILGHPTALLGFRTRENVDLHGEQPTRLNINTSKSYVSSRNYPLNAAFSKTVCNSATTTSIANNPDNLLTGKNKNSVTTEHLVPYILQLVSMPKVIKIQEKKSRSQTDTKRLDSLMESGSELARMLHPESVQLSDDENETDDNDDNNSSNTDPVLTEIIDNKINNTNINHNNSNDNHPHSYENQIEPQHSGTSSSRCQEDGDSEDDDSDNQEAAHSDAENDDETNETNPHTLSLIYFVRREEPILEPVDNSSKPIPESIINIKKRSISPEIRRDNDNNVHNSDDHQNKSKRNRIKRTLLKSFTSSVNTKINFKRPSLPITIPTHLFFDQPPSNSIKQEDELSIEKSQRISKRYANGSLKHSTTNTDMIDGLSQFSSSLNNQTPTGNDSNQKKTKTSHVQDKVSCKQDLSNSISPTATVKNDLTSISNSNSSNETDNKIRQTSLQSSNTATVAPTITTQPKKEKPTANVKPLQQSTTIDNLSSTNSITTGNKIPDNLTTSNTRAIHPSTKPIYAKLKNMSTTNLAALAREKKKQADKGKRTTFEEVREAMGLYLESVCFFIQCANDEGKQDQRAALLKSTLTMLQQLAQNHKKMFQLSNSNQSNEVNNLYQKFLLINYWLQSFVHQTQYNTNMPNIERCANQVTEYFNQLKNPSSAASLTKTTSANHQQQSTPNNDNNPISPLSTTSQTSSSDLSTTSANNSNSQHRYIYDFSEYMLDSYNSTFYWNKAEALMRQKPLKEFTEQLLNQNQKRRLSRDDTTLDFLLYIFDAIELLRLTVA